MCFNASLTVKMYAMLPGKKIFLSNYHPQKTIEAAAKVSGAKFFRMMVSAKQSERVADRGDCINNGTHLTSIIQTYDNYETW